MPTVEELVKKYEELTEDKLFTIYNQIEDYSPEAKTAVNIVLDKKGGLEAVKERVKKQFEIEDEIDRIKNESAALLRQGNNEFDIRKKVQSTILNHDQVIKAINAQVTVLEEQKEDVKIKPRTIAGGILGVTIGSVVSGAIWGFQMIYSAKIYVFVIASIAIINYSLIWLFTKQSYKNTAVIVLLIISVFFAVLIGCVSYEIFGYRGQLPR